MRQRRSYILEKDGRSLYLQNGVVSSATRRRPLAYGPLGMNDFSIAWERDVQKNCVVENISLPLAFVLDDAEILRDQFYKSNIDRELFLLLTQHELQYPTPTTYRHFYKKLYKAQFDFTSWQDDGVQVKLKVDEGGTSRKLKANSKTIYEIPIDDSDYEVVKMDGIVLQMKQNFLIPKSLSAEVFSNGVHLVGVSMTAKEGEASGFAAFTVYRDNDEPGDYVNDTRYFFTTTQPIEDLRIAGNVKVKPIGSSALYELKLITSKGRTFTLVSQTLPTVGADIAIDLTIDTQEDEHFFLVASYGNTFIPIAYDESTLAVSFASRYPTTYVKVLRLSVLAKKLVKQMGISEDYIDTSFVETFDNYVLLSGDANRSLPNAAIKTSFDKFIDFCKVVLAAGQGVVQDQIIIRGYDDFFKTANPIAIPSVKNLVVTDATELRFNRIKIGYPAQDIDDVNGRYSFNNTHSYGTPCNAIDKELNLVCDYLADPYVIEIHRLNLEGKTTTDNERDNTVFILDTTLNTVHFSGAVLFDTVTDNPYLSFTGNDDRIDLFQPGIRFTVSNSTGNNTTLTVVRTEVLTGGFNVFVKEPVTTEAAASVTIAVKYRTLRRDSYDTIEGIPEVSKDSIFNVSLNPAFLVLRHIKWINSVLYNYPGDYVKFISTEKNSGLKYTQGTFTFKQNTDFAIGTQRLFLPFFIDTDSEEPADLIDEMEQDPHRLFTFGNNVSGFVRKVAVQVSTHQEQAYKLLAGPDTNLLTIHTDAYAQ